MAFKEYGDHDGMGLARLVRTKEVSARELLDEAVARTARVDPQINAVVVKHYDYAKRQIDNGLPDGPFTGVPFLLKDLDILEGTRTTSGASVYKDNVADHTSTLTRRFLDAGVAIFGKSSSPEFGLLPTTESRLFGPTRNPWKLGIAFTAKPPYGDAIDQEIAAATREVAALLVGLGHDVEERAPALTADPAAVMATITSASTALNLQLAEQRFGRAMTDSDFERLTLASAHNGQMATATDYAAAQLTVFQISRGLRTFFETCDVFLCPTLCLAPLRIGELNTMSEDLSHIAPILRRYMPATSMFNMSGQPAMSVPLAWNSAGLPLGMMFAARFGDEATLFRLAVQPQQERPWRDKLPPVCVYADKTQPYSRGMNGIRR